VTRLRRRPRVGCAGVGWIGEHRLRAVIEEGAAEIVAVADPDVERRRAGVAAAPGARACASFDELLHLGLDLDGVMIASPSALHAQQAIAALERGLAVFCQKPLARTAAEAARVVAAAAAADRLLAVDLSYRHTEAMRRVRKLVAEAELGRVYALELVFHNAYGPDKAWFYDVELAGGGCVMDLGTHLADLALWLLDGQGIERVSSQLFADGRRLAPGAPQVEDYAVAQLDFASGAIARIACSWNLPAGQDAVIEVCAYGTRGAARARNVGGSFFDFVGERCAGTRTEPLCEPPDAWGGRAAASWARRLTAGQRFNLDAWQLVEVSRTVDRIYGRAHERGDGVAGDSPCGS
jgi:predicted dehydrogenase